MNLKPKPASSVVNGYLIIDADNGREAVYVWRERDEWLRLPKGGGCYAPESVQITPTTPLYDSRPAAVRSGYASEQAYWASFASD